MTFCVNSPIRIISTLLMLYEIQIFSNYKNYIKDIHVYKKKIYLPNAAVELNRQMQTIIL